MLRVARHVLQRFEFCECRNHAEAVEIQPSNELAIGRQLGNLITAIGRFDASVDRSVNPIV